MKVDGRALSSDEKADALEERLMERLPAPAGLPPLRRGAGVIFGGDTPGGQSPPLLPLAPMPRRPTLLDFFRLRFMPNTVTHMLQSATDALAKGEPEDIVFACLVHDLAVNLIKVDHGYWGAQMLEPYVSAKVSWAIRHHQALRFFPDPSVGYEYPEKYVEIFGPDYVPEPYVVAAYRQARKHRWYMAARSITVHDLYAFDWNARLPLDPFVDVIGRRFKQPKEGLGFDGSPIAHMWRSLIYPDHPL
jgi:hypothetical protein